MNEADVTRLAQSAGIEEWAGRLQVATNEQLTRFAALVRAQALEDAAVKCKSVGGMGGDYWTDQCAAAIRGMM